MKNPTIKAIQHRLVGLRGAMLGARRAADTTEAFKMWQCGRRGAYLMALQIIRETR